MINVIDHSSVRELQLARPPANALSPDLLADLTAQIEAAPEDGARALVISGSEGLFTGGLDVPLLLTLDRDEMRRALELFFGSMAALAASKVPVAAAITGHSPAGGAVLSLFCDWRVMAEGPFLIGFNEVRVGIPMPQLVADAVTRVVGRRQAELLCQTGQLIDPDHALSIGLVDRLAPADEVVDAAVEWCEGFVDLPAHALELTRATVRGDLIDGLERSKSAGAEEMTREWFRPEVQGPLRALAEQLAQKRSQSS
jgi:enoyl-CoA hydratase/carnithine racemase